MGVVVIKNKNKNKNKNENKNENKKENKNENKNENRNKNKNKNNKGILLICSYIKSIVYLLMMKTNQMMTMMSYHQHFYMQLEKHSLFVQINEQILWKTNFYEAAQHFV